MSQSTATTSPPSKAIPATSSARPGSAAMGLSPRSIASRRPVFALSLSSAEDRLTILIVILLAGAWLSEGLRTLLGLPHVAVGAVDALEAVVCLWLMIALVRERNIRLLLAAGIYVLWVLTGLIGTVASPGSIALALKDALLLPVFALLVATRGATERRAQAVALTLVGLCAFEFLLTLLQLFILPGAHGDPDFIVGSFGASNNAITGVLMLLVTTLGTAAYLIGARCGRLALAAVCVFSLFSAWAVVKLATLAFPVVIAIVALTALALRRTTLRRGAIAFLAGLVSSGIVVAGYAAFKPDTFNTITTSAGFSNYLSNGSPTGTASPTVTKFAQLGHVVVRGTGNTEVLAWQVPTGRYVFRLLSLNSGPYRAALTAKGPVLARVRPGKKYGFSAKVADGTGSAQTIEPQVEWFTADHQMISRVTARPVSVSGFRPAQPLRALRSIGISAVAPPRAAYELSLITATTDAPAQSSFFMTSTSLRAPTGRLGAARTSTHRGHSRAPGSGHGNRQGHVQHPASTGQTQPQQVPQGHVRLLRMALHTVSGSVGSELFGNGLGYATQGAHVGAGPSSFSPDRLAASQSDFGRILAERGWSGILVVVLLGLLLVILSLRAARTRPLGNWSTAFAVAVPGAVAVLLGYGLVAPDLANRPTALTFWLIIALGIPASVRWSRKKGLMVDDVPGAPAEEKIRPGGQT